MANVTTTPRRLAALLAAALVGALVIAGLPTATPARAAATVAGPLHTSGNQILGANGQEVVLRGVNSSWLTTNTLVWPGTPLGDDSIAAMKSWGANVVRVALGEQFWNAGECQHSSNYPSTVDQVVNSITSRGMVALLELHSNTRIPCLPAGQQRMADSPGSIAFWQSVAARYKDNPLVAFDLYNEPNNVTWNQWRNGGLLIDGAVAWNAAGMQEMYDAVRSTGAQNLVVISGNDWANDPPPPQYMVQGYNIGYAVHSYPSSCSSGLLNQLLCTGRTPPNPTAPGASLPLWDQFLATNPVLVTEFGAPSPSSGTYNQDVISWADSHGVGWMAFEWGVGAYTSGAQYGLLATMSPSYLPDGAGDPVQQALAEQP